MLSSISTTSTSTSTTFKTTTESNLSILLLNGFSYDQIQKVINENFTRTNYLEVIGPNWDAKYETLYYGPPSDFHSIREAYLISSKKDNLSLAMASMVKNVNYYKESKIIIPFKLLVIDANGSLPDIISFPHEILSFYHSIYILSTYKCNMYLELGMMDNLYFSLFIMDCPIERAAIKYLRSVQFLCEKEFLIGEHLDNPTLSTEYKEKLLKLTSAAGILLNPSPDDILREKFIKKN